MISEAYIEKDDIAIELQDVVNKSKGRNLLLK